MSLHRQAASVRISVTDREITAYAGAVLLRETARALGVVSAVDANVGLKRRARGLSEGEFVAGTAEAIALGARCLDDLAVARADVTQTALRGFEIAAPQTAGTWLRRFTLGHIRQFDKALAEVVRTAFAAAGTTATTLDFDSSYIFSRSRRRQGADRTYKRGYACIRSSASTPPPALPCTRACVAAGRGLRRAWTRSCARRCAASPKGSAWARGWTPVSIPSGSSRRPTARGSRSSAGCRSTPRSSPRSARSPTNSGVVASTTNTARSPSSATGCDRRAGSAATSSSASRSEWASNHRWKAAPTTIGAASPTTTPTAAQIESEHRHKALVESGIRELKSNFGLHALRKHGFMANWAWVLLACLAHNLCCWTQQLSRLEAGRDGGDLRAKRFRYRYLVVPALLVRSARRLTLKLRADYPYRRRFSESLQRLRMIPAPAT